MSKGSKSTRVRLESIERKLDRIAESNDRWAWDVFVVLLACLCGILLGYWMTDKMPDGIEEGRNGQVLVICEDESTQWFSLPQCGRDHRYGEE
jgi:hypothetical protein